MSRDAISNTGPILHLQEINLLTALGVFDRIFIPELVAQELHSHGFDLAQFDVEGLTYFSPKASS